MESKEEIISKEIRNLNQEILLIELQIKRNIEYSKYSFDKDEIKKTIKQYRKKIRSLRNKIHLKEMQLCPHILYEEACNSDRPIYTCVKCGITSKKSIISLEDGKQDISELFAVEIPDPKIYLLNVGKLTNDQAQELYFETCQLISNGIPTEKQRDLMSEIYYSLKESQNIRKMVPNKKY